MATDTNPSVRDDSLRGPARPEFRAARIDGRSQVLVPAFTAVAEQLRNSKAE